MRRSRDTGPKLARRLRYFERRVAKARNDRDRGVFREQAKRARVSLTLAKRCLNCGRRLENAASIEAGYGPDCLAKLAARAATEAPT